MDGNVLYYGDNLDVVRRYIEDESVDLVYLDPPFKSDQNYNAHIGKWMKVVLACSCKGTKSRGGRGEDR